MDKIDYLKFYSGKGWQSFPCRPNDKTPLVKWADVATCEINMLNGWLEQWPEMNIGIATGKRSGIFVLDVDAGHGGEESLAALIADHGELPNTPIALTGGGGKHYIFQHPDIQIRNVQNSGKLGKGLDIRGDGGYIVVAPSKHPSGTTYAWDKNHAPSTTPLAPAPEWMLKILTASAPVVQSENVEDKSAIANGGRNNTLTSIAGVMRRKGMSEDAIYSALLVENKQKCIPPLSESEVRQIASSVTRYTPESVYEQNRDRLQVEWAFCKSIYEYPLNAPDFTEVLPSMFQDHTLSDFWARVQDNQDVTDSALSAGIVTELERYKDYDFTRLDGYARSIRRFAYLSDVVKKAESLKHQAQQANDAGIDRAMNEINKIPSQAENRVISISDVADDLETFIRERAKNPVDVWGIHYAWERLSILTGGKQKGELTLFAGEPGAGKSWWNLQDILYTAIGNPSKNIDSVPVFYWSGEMKRMQVMTRLYQILGVDGKKMKTGNMKQDDWDLLADAKALILNSPLAIDDRPLFLHEVKPILMRQKASTGLYQAVFDYESLIQAPGKDEIEQSANTSRELKRIAQELDIAITLISSVNKGGMDKGSEFVSKSDVRGSGQKLHDADIVYMLTAFDKSKGIEYRIDPKEYDKCVSLHIKKGRELVGVENGFIPYMRETNSPKFREVTK